MQARSAPVSKPELALAAVTLFMFAEAFLPRLLSPGATDVTGEIPESTFLRYLWLPFYGLVFVGLIVAGRQVFSAVIRSPFMLVLALLAMASSLWSIDPDLSFRRGVALLATTLLGVYLAARYDWISLLRLIGLVWFGLMAASFIAGIVAPGFARMGEVHPGAWMGGWWEKNALGGHAARAAFLFGFLAWRDDPWRKFWCGAFLLAAALVVLSKSATALLGTMLGVAVLVSAWWMLRGRRHTLALIWAGVSVVGALVLVYVAAPGALLGLIGRDATLTGRTDIWVELLNAISERPALGYGYLAFWALDSEPRYWLSKAVDWPAPSGHNGWLDLAISLGLVGVAIFAIDLCLTLWRATKLSLGSPAGVFALGFLAQFLLFAMSESIIIAQNSILWATYCMVSAKLALDMRAASTARTPQFSEALASR
jgi:O-antigen ligase